MKNISSIIFLLLAVNLCSLSGNADNAFIRKSETHDGCLWELVISSDFSINGSILQVKVKYECCVCELEL